MRCFLALGCMLVGSLAYADKPRSVADKVRDETSTLFSGVAGGSEKKPVFAFTVNEAVIAPADFEEATSVLPDVARPWTKRTTVAVSTDGTSAWIASDLEGWVLCGDRNCYKGPPDEWFRISALYEVAGLAPVAWHFSEPITAKEQKTRLAKGAKLDALVKGVGAGAEDAVRLFEGSIGDPKALAKTVSDRKDVVLYGSEFAERYVGGATVKKQILKWNLGLKINGGVQAGVTASKTVAWIAAHVDATPAKNANAKPTPYRLFVIYEKAGADWKLVSAHFSFY